MALDVHRIFHETWLGEAQPSEGLTFSVPVLCDGGVMQKLSAAQAHAFAAHAVRPVSADTADDSTDTPGARILDLRACLLGFFGWAEDELHGQGRQPQGLVLRLAEEGTELRPTLAIPRGQRTPTNSLEAPPSALEAGEHTAASRAGQPYQMLVWELPTNLDLDAAESETTTWHYPPTAKFERLLRETRVPMGLLANGERLRLVYCPPGHATGWIEFRVGYMATPAGRDMLSALRELLHADRIMGGMPDTPTTLELLELSRERQADVTTRLGEQVREALQILLEGFEAAGHRDGTAAMREAMRQEGNYVYEGLLNVMLRLIFALYAEDRGLLPVEHPVYAGHLSVSGLYADLVADADAYGDTMDRRFGAWPRLIMLFRALYFGLEYRDPTGDPTKALSMPPHRGRLFNPENHAFLEGCLPAGGAPVSPVDRAQTRLPSISDGVIYRVLRRLLVLDGQRLSYSALEEEQLGSVYEGLMGYQIERRFECSVCLAPSRVWVGASDLLRLPRATRVRWLQDAGVTAAGAKRLAAAVEVLEDTHDPGPALEAEVLATLREFSVAPPAKRSSKRRASEALAAEVAPDRLVIQPGEERRRTSSHYTPRSLSGPIVKRTLEPLLAAIRARVARERPDVQDPQPGSEDLLSLKICDPAMGSGAFLVEACRFMATQLVAAWVREGVLERELDAAGDDEARRKPEQLARRIVAQRCLFGVDKNPLAVELGKLSLWLLTLSRGQTFTFLDHCLKAGDSLVGLNKSQILRLDWSDSSASSTEGSAKKTAKQASKAASKKTSTKRRDSEQPQIDLFADQTLRAFAKATLARQRLAALARTSDSDDTERRQHELHIDAERALERLRDVADILLSTYFFPYERPETLTPEFLFRGEKVSDKDRKNCLGRVRDELNFWLMQADSPPLPKALELRRALIRENIRPMHWELEFPEVFSDERQDPLMEDGIGKAWVDAVVGNPPFAGKNGIIDTNGPAYLTWLTAAYTPSHGNSDLSAYFFRRADWMLGANGTLGLIATNTIGQGDTRMTGLQPIVAANGRIYEVIQDLKWPVKGANVSVSVVHLAKGSAAHAGLRCSLDGRNVDVIDSQLRSSSERVEIVKLNSNHGRSFRGSIVLGKGFMLMPKERDALLSKDLASAERIFPYIGGQEINSSPNLDHDRYVVDFGDMSLAEAEKWPSLLDFVRLNVKPERDQNKREARKKYWWKFGERATGLYEEIKSLTRCLACSNVSKYSVFAFQPVDRVFSNTLVVFSLPKYCHFGLLQSRVHEFWARLHGSTLEDRLRYSPSDCFETFPFPDEPTLAANKPLEAIAERLYTTRAAYMVATDQGLTKTYNALTDPTNTDPEVEHLRRLHEQLDRAVLDAYGQTSITVPPYTGATPEQLERFQDEVLEFLFARNALLAKREAAAQARAKP
jgi:hypothetical protein